MQVWVGTDRGIVFIYDSVSYQFISRLEFHVDAVVSSTCAAGSGAHQLVFTAAGKLDGRVAVWRCTREPRRTVLAPAKH